MAQRDHLLDQQTKPIGRYGAFGLCIRSEIALPQLTSPPADASVDAEIVLGDVPARIAGVVNTGVRYQSAPGRLRLQVDGIATFLVEDGKRIIVSCDPRASDDDVRTFLLASALAALLHQRGDLVLHASAVVANNEAIVFLGTSGVGKSTLANALRKRGYPLLADDLCIVRRQSEGRLCAFPAFPQTKLWLDSLKHLDMAADGLRRVRATIEKRLVPLTADFHTEPVPVRRLYVLCAHNLGRIEAIPLQGPAKFKALKNNTYRFGFIAGGQSQAGHFGLAMRLAQQADVVLLKRPSQSFDLDALAQRIEADLRS